MSMGLSPPNWCTDEVWKKLENIAAMIFDIFTYTNDMKKIVVGPTIKRFLKNINSSASQRNKKKIYLYSAHDYNVVSFIRAHNFTSPRHADFGSAVLFEKLKGDDGRPYIRVSICIYDCINRYYTCILK